MSSLSEALRQVRLPDERNQELLVAAADALDRAEAASVRDHQNTMHMIQSLTDLFREEKAAWQVERAAYDKAMGEVIRGRNECRAMLDRQADKDGGQQREGVVTDDMRYAVRFAPSSAHWSERLVEFFGPDAREGIDALERQLREARAALSAPQAEQGERDA